MGVSRPMVARAALLILALSVPFLCAGCASGAPASEGGAPPRQVSVRVYYGDSTTPNVLVNVPLRAVTTAIRFATIARAFGASIELGDDDHRRVDLNEVDLEKMRKALATMEPGPVLQVEEGGERVEIWID